MVAVADRLIDSFASDGRCDVVERFTGEFSIEVACRLIGIPVEDIPTFANATKELALIFATPLDPVADRLDAALRELWVYSEDLVARRRRMPADQRPDDFISALIESQETQEKIEGDELIWGISNILFGAMDTTRFQIVGCLQGLINHGLWEDVAADPTLVPGLVEEATRMYPVIGFTPRMTLEDADIAGVVVPAGTIVIANTMSAYLDPEQFPDPYRFDITRELGHRLIFGRGLHKCLGDRLAWMILETAVERLTARLTNVRTVEEAIFTPRSEQLIGHEKYVIDYAPR
jgi:cytochrome P450